MLSFAPDAIDIAPEALTAVSAVPTLRGYKTPPSGITANTTQFSGTSTGGAYCVKLDGSTRTFLATSTYIYESASGWTDRSRAGNYTAGTSRWRFAQFGDTTLAINKATVLQSSTTGAFADVANAPKAACMEAVAGFVLLANVDDSGLAISGGPNANQQHRWWCSGLFTPTSTWAPSASTQATTGLLVETPGAIQQLKSIGNDCVAYKASSIYVGRYVGPPVVWQWQCVSTDVGTSAPESVVAVGQTHYFIGDSDIYAFNGAQTTPIGTLIKTWFYGRLNRSFVANIQALHDESAKLVYWFYPSGSTGTLNSVLVYHYDTQRWGAFDLTVADVVKTVTGQVTYDGLGTLYTNYDDMPDIAYDSPYWAAATPVLAYLSSTNYLMSLSGSGSEMTMTTGYFGDENVVTLCTRVRPRMRTAPTAGTITASSVMTLGDAATTGATSTLHDGRFDVLQAARYHKFALTLSGSCEIEAIAPTLVPQGAE